MANTQQLPDFPDVCSNCGERDFETHYFPADPSEPANAQVTRFSHYTCEECGEAHNDQRPSKPDPDEVEGYYIDDWEDIFGHPSPYPHQRDGIEAAIDNGKNHGFSLIEGGCGTGKTMIALTAGVKLVRDPSSKYERVFVLTSVKQQLRQFENDLRIINKNLPDGIQPIESLSLQGKVDLCPYRREGVGGFTRGNCHRRCKRLRANTASLAQGEAENLAQMYQDSEKQARLRSSMSDTLETAGAESPYLEELSEMNDTQYCPFYAKYKAQDNTVMYDISDAENSIMDTEELARVATEYGSCPHSGMSALLPEAEVVIGNYYHAFDDGTLKLTQALVDEKTYLVCDEAHMLVPRVRSILSDSVDLFEVKMARQELARILRHADDATKNGQDGFVFGATELLNEYKETGRSGAYIDPALAREEFEKSGMGISVARLAFEFLTELEANMREYTDGWLDSEYPNWENELFDLPDYIEIALRNPKQPAPDVITKWADNAGYAEELWEELENIGTIVERIINKADNDAQDAVLKNVGKVLRGWYKADDTQYFREVVLREDPMKNMPGWRRRYEASLELHNCIPTYELSNQLNKFGGGILMSATLDPIDVFRELAGLDYLRDFCGRPIAERRYPIDFPEQNRESLLVNAPKYTHGNRGNPSAKNETRSQYREAIVSTAQSPGNTLVCMPSYGEAEWAANQIKQSSVNKPVLIDTSSGETETQKLKKSFFSGGDKVLVTSLRGTLIEGVDYKGDKLSGVVICGVPIENVGSPQTKAVQTAYEDRFGQFKGFQYSMLVPAVRKTRQAIGRVIRGSEDVGVRVLVDERYAQTDGFSAAGQYLGEEADDFTTIPSSEVGSKLSSFWKSQGREYPVN